MSGSLAGKPPLGGFDATTVGIGCMVGGGIFVVLPRIAEAAGFAVAASLALAALVAYCSAASTFLLGAGLRNTGRGNEGGTTRSAARVLLGPYMGFVTGWTLVCALLAAAAVLALAFGLYVAPDFARPAAAGAAVAATALILFGVFRGPWVLRFVLAFVLGVLGFGVVVAINEAGLRPPQPEVLQEPTSTTGLLQGAGFAFFAFAGYSRLAAGGYKVRDPERNLARALPAAVLLTLGLYILVAQSLLAWFQGPAALAGSLTPLREPVAAVGLGIGTAAVAVAAGAACLSGAWVLLESVARTAAAMAADGDLPRVFGHTGRTRHVPWPACAVAGAVVVTLVLTASLDALLALACFALLLHAAITNLCGYTLDQRRWYTPRAVNLAGLAGALIMALSLPPMPILLMLIVLVAGYVVRLVFPRAEA
ncbi:amino acid permease [Arthrobacter jiangjiafuii]|uniref:Amino acid permease n=1 Tax=Arthrobacter jiangjiafuii TaxID=2817475 RepID=A0A975M2T7_9MICC|nr:amino acid permease [Arthrobacter jiangjiafuii]MBP3043390.1 APC family permease [Arthrobacter jiangjiafuii]QWC08923.1 amino acid permease [Arthrobacter jiangjiafuii]